MTPTTLGYHHTSLEAPSEPELDRSILAWRQTFERELALLVAHPEGVSITHQDCCGTHNLVALPHWAPSPSVPPATLSFHFSVQKLERHGGWVGHLCAELHTTPLPRGDR